jgi:hypothetical protein
LTSNHLPLTALGSNPYRDLDFFMWGSYPASYGTLVVLLRCPFMPEIMHGCTWGLPPPVKLERRNMTYTVSMWRKTQSKQTKKWVRIFNFAIYH